MWILALPEVWGYRYYNPLELLALAGVSGGQMPKSVPPKFISADDLLSAVSYRKEKQSMLLYENNARKKYDLKFIVATYEWQTEDSKIDSILIFRYFAEFSYSEDRRGRLTPRTSDQILRGDDIGHLSYNLHWFGHKVNSN